MQQDLIYTIKSNPRYHKLVSKRIKFAWLLVIAMLAIYFGFILIVAFNKQILAQPLWAGSVVTVGIVVGIGVILSAFALVVIYTLGASSVFDKLTNEIKGEVL